MYLQLYLVFLICIRIVFVCVEDNLSFAGGKNAASVSKMDLLSATTMHLPQIVFSPKCGNIFQNLQNIVCLLQCFRYNVEHQHLPKIHKQVYFCQDIRNICKKIYKIFCRGLVQGCSPSVVCFLFKEAQTPARPSRGSDRRGFEFRSLPLRGLTLLCGIYEKRK